MRVTKPSFFQKKLGKSIDQLAINILFYLSLYGFSVEKHPILFLFFYILFRFSFMFIEFSNYFIMHDERNTVVRFFFYQFKFLFIFIIPVEFFVFFFLL